MSAMCSADENIHRPYGTRVVFGFRFPTLKRGAKNHCAYGALTEWRAEGLVRIVDGQAH